MPKRGRELIEDGLPYLYDFLKQQKLTPVFWTGTVPTHYADGSPIGFAGERLLLERWPELMRRVFEELCRELERLGLPQRFLYVVELQERLVPHFHAVIPNVKRHGSWALSIYKTDELWGRMIGNVLGKPVDIRSACNLVPIHGMTKLADYMQKVGKIGSYMSKGSPLIKRARAEGIPLPNSWYGSDLQTRQEVRASVLVVHCENSDIGRLQAAIDEVEGRMGRSVFVKPFLVVKDEVSWYVSALTQVRKLADIDLAFAHLLPLLFDPG